MFSAWNTKIKVPCYNFNGTVQERLREFHPLSNANGLFYLIYDLERTFVIPVPTDMQAGLTQTLKKGTMDETICRWMQAEGLLTSESYSTNFNSQGTLPKITDVSFDLSADCNMNCEYCFEKDINSRIKPMSLHTVMKALDWAFEQASLSGRLVLHFGSGEPLIRFELIQQIVYEIQKRSAKTKIKVSFELTTNATLVTEYIAKFLSEHPFNVRVSCDGPPHLHNRTRKLIMGENSYEIVEKGLKIFLNWMGNRVTVNSVLTSGNRLSEIWDWAKRLNIRHFHVIKVGAASDDLLNISAQDIVLFRKDLETICDEILSDLESGCTPIDYQPITKLVKRLMIPMPITRFCGVSGTYLGVAADGRIYPCFRHIGLKEYALGDVYYGINHGKRSCFLKKEAADVDNRPICQTCWVRYLCGGGCYADSTVYSYRKTEPQTKHCPFWQAEVETAIRFYHKIISSEPYNCFLLFGVNPNLFDPEELKLHFLGNKNCS